MDWQLRAIADAPRAEHALEIRYDHGCELGEWFVSVTSRFDDFRKYGQSFADDPAEAVREAIERHGASGVRLLPSGAMAPFDPEKGDVL